MNNKTKHNSYGYNSSNLYNKQIVKTKVYFPVKKNPYYDGKYENQYVLSEGDASGTVWTNNNVYDIKTEDPGISWIL
jgi:hypothetical protein